jgi:hypothetical protein
MTMNQHQEYEMSEHTRDHETTDADRALLARVAWGRRAADERARTWTAELAVAGGDRHHKGESTLCVGEAA